MVRPIVILTTTLLFGLFGLLIGYLTVKARPMPNTDLLLAAYGAAPFLGTILGFVLSVLAFWLFTPPRKP
jgi:hypothetical protein